MSANIGLNIRNARKALHLSQEELGELIGANRVTISRYETNEYNPSIPALKRLAEALKTTPAELSGDEPDTKKEPAIPDRLDDALIDMLVNLSPDEVQRVQDFVAGMKAAKTT